MGTFRVTIEIGRREQGPYRKVEALVDAGALYTWLPGSIVEDLEVKRAFRRQFVLADGRTIERDVSVVVARLDGQILATLAIFGDERAEPLLGAYTLGGVRLGARPHQPAAGASTQALSGLKPPSGTGPWPVRRGGTPVPTLTIGRLAPGEFLLLFRHSV